MRTIPQIKKDIEFNKGLSGLLEVLKLVAVSQFRALEQRLKSFEKLADALDSCFELIDVRNSRHPFLNPENKSCCVIAVTSDVGLLGGLNIQVINTAFSELEKRGGGEIAVIGERGQLYARERNASFTGFKGINEQERFSQACKLQEWVFSRMFANAFGSLITVYPRALSITIQRIETAHLLPYAVPEKYKLQGDPSVYGGVLYESSPAVVVEYAVKLWLTHKFHEIFGLSRLAEFASRFIHLEESAQRTKDMQGNLRQQYFRQRHEIIDRSMRELFTARSLYANKSS